QRWPADAGLSGLTFLSTCSHAERGFLSAKRRCGTGRRCRIWVSRAYQTRRLLADPRARWMKSRNSCARRYHSGWKSQATSAPNLDELSARPAQLRERRAHSAAALQREEPNPQRTTSLLPASAEYIDWYRRICLGERLKSNSTYRGITAPAVSGRRQCLHQRSASYCVRRISIKGFSTACLLTLSACL